MDSKPCHMHCDVRCTQLHDHLWSCFVNSCFFSIKAGLVIVRVTRALEAITLLKNYKSRNYCTPWVTKMSGDRPVKNLSSLTVALQNLSKSQKTLFNSDNSPYFVRKAILAFNYSITSTFDSTSTDRPALKVKVALPLHCAWAFPCNALKKR